MFGVWNLAGMLPRNQRLWVRDPTASPDRLDNTCMALGRRKGTRAGVSQKCQVPESGGGRSSKDSNSPWKRASAVSLPGREAEVLVIQSGPGSPRARGCGVEDDARGRTLGTFLRLRAAAAAAAASTAPKVYTASSPVGLHHLLQTQFLWLAHFAPSHGSPLGPIRFPPQLSHSEGAPGARRG